MEIFLQLVLWLMSSQNVMLVCLCSIVTEVWSYLTENSPHLQNDDRTVNDVCCSKCL
jgi:hypothetical protein